MPEVMLTIHITGAALQMILYSIHLLSTCLEHYHDHHTMLHCLFLTSDT
jgi:hypothetical protein